MVEGTETVLGKCKMLYLDTVGYGNIYSRHYSLVIELVK
jgi:hypothetical protein